MITDSDDSLAVGWIDTGGRGTDNDEEEEGGPRRCWEADEGGFCNELMAEDRNVGVSGFVFEESTKCW